MNHILKPSAIFTVLLAVGGCATYHALPLAESSNLKTGLEQLNLTVPSKGSNNDPTKINPEKPLSPDKIGLVAVLNSPSHWLPPSRKISGPL
ncbi:MAG: hypothetical protein P8126_01130 [Gammaproteobacteria bacterium]